MLAEKITLAKHSDLHSATMLLSTIRFPKNQTTKSLYIYTQGIYSFRISSLAHTFPLRKNKSIINELIYK